MSLPHQAADDDHEERHAHHAPARPISDAGHGSSWTLVPDAYAHAHADTGADSSPPRVSLFSPQLPSQSPVERAPIVTPVHVGSSPPSNSSRPLATLAGVASMKRNARLKVMDAQPPPPIVQFSSQIPSAQKDADDPTTPPDSSNSRDNTRGREYTTLTTLSRLFAGDGTMPSSRTPSYNQASGPLYMRGTLTVA
jgi:hypothetical protein